MSNPYGAYVDYIVSQGSNFTYFQESWLSLHSRSALKPPDGEWCCVVPLMTERGTKVLEEVG